MEIYIILYIILSGFVLLGTDMFGEEPTFTKYIICLISGWILTPCLICFSIGRLIEYIKDLY